MRAHSCTDNLVGAVKRQTLFLNMRQGGVGLVIYDVNKDVAKSGVQVGDLFFPGYKQKGGQYACLFAFPQGMTLTSRRKRSSSDFRSSSLPCRLSRNALDMIFSATLRSRFTWFAK